jgi:hypothetical protein
MERHRRQVRSWAVSLALCVGALLPVVTPRPAAAQETTPPQTLTFSYTGTAQQWTVPADVHQATFDVYGAQGANRSVFPGAAGGRTTATIAVTPGEVITIMVGGQGRNNPPTADCVLTAGTGGFNGGGNGGDVGGNCPGPGGGGASDVRRGGSALSNRVLVAGGGGGAAANIICNQAGSGGGVNGGSATQNAFCSGGGTGGNQDGTSGSGQLGQGGQGADGDGISSAGGGGGGGYYGGSGGNPGLGGGGGSGFGVNAVMQNGVRQGNGVVTVAFGAAPTVTDVSPNTGPARGGFDTVITGTNFVPGQTSVMFGSTPSPQVECESTTVCHAVSPAGSGGVSIIVTANGQQSLDGNDDDYFYFGDPTITAITPTQGPQGTVVTIHGTNFMPPPWVNLVEFGDPSRVVTPSCPSPTECTAVSPPGVGAVNLTLGTQQGPSNAVPFTMLPGVTSISPAGGPGAGGTAVTITGTGFNTAAGATTVHFGSGAALAVGCATTTTCTAVSPPGSGTVSVRVTVSGLQSLDTPADDFLYSGGEGEPPPDASADLAALEAAVRATGGAGRALAPIVDRAGAAVEAGRPAVACGLLRTFVVVVRLFGAVGQLPANQSSQFVAEATRIRGTLNCR